MSEEDGFIGELDGQTPEIEYPLVWPFKLIGAVHAILIHRGGRKAPIEPNVIVVILLHRRHV